MSSILRLTAWTALLALLGAVGDVSAARAEVGINLFGVSHHFTTRWDDDLEEFNPGLGVNWAFHRTARVAFELDGGVYRDSYRNANVHGALGARLRLVGPFEFGLKMIAAKSASVNDNRWLVTPYPLLGLRWSRVVLNGAYIPEVSGVNADATLGMYVTVYPFGEGWRRDPRARPESSDQLEFAIASGLHLQAPDRLSVAWRHLFSPRYGLRLGVRMRIATVETRWDSGTADGTAEEDQIDTALEIQYLRRYRVEARIRPWWAIGPRVGTDNRSRGSDGLRDDESHVVTWALAANVGLECAVTGTLAVTVDYGLTYSEYAWMQIGTFSWKRHDERQELASQATLGLVAGF